MLKDNTGIHEFTENFTLHASVDSCISLIATPAPLFQMQAVSTMLDSITTMQMSKIILYTGIMETACIAKYCLLPCRLPAFCAFLQVNQGEMCSQSRLDTANVSYKKKFHKLALCYEMDFILLEDTAWLQRYSHQNFKLTPTLKMLV